MAEDRMMPIYEKLMESGLLTVMHTGYDIAFERIRRCDPLQVLVVMERFPGLKLVTTHLGAWEQWDEVREMLLGKPIFMEISFSVEYLGAGLGEFIEAHPPGYILFGTDSPWTGQKKTLDAVRGLGLKGETLDAVLGGNAMRLLGMD